MNIQKMLINFAKWFFIGQGIVWSFLTFYIVVTDISVREQGIGFAWIVSILFAVVMTYISNIVAGGHVDKDGTNFFE